MNEATSNDAEDPSSMYYVLGSRRLEKIFHDRSTHGICMIISRYPHFAQMWVKIELNLLENHRAGVEAHV